MTAIVRVFFIQIHEVYGLAVMPISYCNFQHGYVISLENEIYKKYAGREYDYHSTKVFLFKFVK